VLIGENMITEKDLEQKRHAARTHGLYAFKARGEDALDTVQRSRYAELKELFDSDQGREAYRREFAAHLAMMCELGFSHIRDEAEAGRDIWKSSPAGRMGSYVNALIRLLDNWPKGSDMRSISEVILEQVRAENEQKNT
jgi:hypothetical protein